MESTITRSRPPVKKSKMDQINLPEKVLTQQICTNCGQYLSVGPVTISPGDGGGVCGRCPKNSLAVNSLYNIIAEKCLFKCVNHYTECKQLFLFAEAQNHEQGCISSDYVCPFCKYVGNGCQLVCHFRKFHTNYVVQGDTLEQIISYKYLNIIKFTSNMSIKDLKLFIATASKLFLNCGTCGSEFGEETVYVCPKYHAVCVDCCKKKCSKCDMLCQWNSKSRLHSILLECEWKNCSVKTNVFTYMRHKRFCKFRQYRCPDGDCGLTCNLKKLKDHWHMSPIETERKVNIHSSMAYYWLIPDHNELLYVTVEYSSWHSLIITAAEINSIVPFSFALTLKYYNISDLWMTKMLELKYSALKPSRYIKCENYHYLNIYVEC